MSCADHFSAQATDYAKYRPGYPPALFDWLQSLTTTHDLAWDVGSGNGQAARELARFFTHVVATDPSAAQIANAVAHPRIAFRVQAAEQCDLATASVDLITIAQALHWFDFAAFFAQARRVLKPAGALVAWTYGINTVTAEVDAVVSQFYSQVVGPYWPPERIHVERGYRDIDMPLLEIAAPTIAMSTTWTADDYLGYLRTWSATQRYSRERGHDPVNDIAIPLRRAWGAEATRVVHWPLQIRAGRR